jgi:hypothetical protein
VLWVIMGCLGCILCEKRLRLSWKVDESSPWGKGTKVALACNTSAALNDITHDEIAKFLDDVAGGAAPDVARHVIDTHFEPSFLALNGIR